MIDFNHLLFFLYYHLIFMIKYFSRFCNPTTLNLKTKAPFAQDWSHVYDGIFRFEDKKLGEDVLAIR